MNAWMTPSQVFSPKRIGPNFMTPRRIKLYAAGRYAIELSAGVGFDGVTKLYGVSVRSRVTGDRDEHSGQFDQVFYDLRLAMRHVHDAQSQLKRL